MYYLVYGFLYLVSLLPGFILYRIADFGYFIIYYVIGYRKAVVASNLAIAFPGKTEAERKRIAKQFYKNFIDTFVETIEMLSMTEKRFREKCTFDFSASNAIAAKGLNIHFVGGHQMNWEYATWGAVMGFHYPLMAVYSPIGNKLVNRIFLKLRSKYHLILVAGTDFKNQTNAAFQQQYAIGMIGDQTPSNPAVAYWLNFFGRPSAFLTGPDKGMITRNPAVIFVTVEKKRRGHYHLAEQVITEQGASLQPGEFTNIYRDMLEAALQKDPTCYLWSHRRWKYEYKAAYETLWIDAKNPPPEVRITND